MLMAPKLKVKSYLPNLDWKSSASADQKGRPAFRLLTLFYGQLLHSPLMI